MESAVDPRHKISIITPFYNPGKFLEPCILSILDQTYQNWELILVNDQSTDESPKIAQHYSSIDSRIIYFHNTEKGLIQALKLAYNQSTGSFLTRMDADDLMTPKRLELMLQELTKHKEGFVCIGNVKYFSEAELGQGYIIYERWLNKLTNNRNNFSEIYRECTIPSPNFLIYRDDFDKIGAFEPDQYPEDYDLAFRMYQKRLKICSVPEITLYWRDHALRSTRTQEHYKSFNFIQLKVKYFLQIDRLSSKPLIIWGAGKKGKAIAKEFIKNQVEFLWITENPKKIGIQIYERSINHSDQISLHVESQIIIAVSNPEEQQEILAKLEYLEGHQIFSFF
ncbi:MAG: glycosyltransferase [Flavobacteriales bacterium]|nr:glycosyltransferase [Flavobacteriales bacterium]